MQKNDIYSFRKIVVYTPPQKKWYIVHRKKKVVQNLLKKMLHMVHPKNMVYSPT